MRTGNNTNDVLQLFGKSLIEQGKSVGTFKTYSKVVEHFLNYLIVNKIINNIDDIDAKGVHEYVESLKQENKSSSTIEKHIAAINIFLCYIEKPHIRTYLPRKQKENTKLRPQSLTKEEEIQLLHEIELDGNIRNIAIVYLLLHTGIRVSELCNLNKTDIKIGSSDEGQIVVRDEGSLHNSRMIPLSTFALKHLLRYLDSLDTDSNALFISSFNQRITTRAVQYMLKKYNVHPHLLRHTFCYRLVDHGVDLNTVSKLAGHKDINITKRYVKKDAEHNMTIAIKRTFA
ncbi:tyrosine-type recombinase/integrase [Bacillus salitolerans]|uniref:Tyrosine-type recombinase/integrase n=1 Tax=Bacillus salitolerans TaxID=1437434 RepID=A0ABW4LQG8_9BACI